MILIHINEEKEGGFTSYLSPWTVFKIIDLHVLNLFLILNSKTYQYVRQGVI